MVIETSAHLQGWCGLVKIVRAGRALWVSQPGFRRKVFSSCLHTEKLHNVATSAILLNKQAYFHTLASLLCACTLPSATAGYRSLLNWRADKECKKGIRATFSSLQRVDIASTPSVCFSVSIAMSVAVGGVGGGVPHWIEIPGPSIAS